MIPFGLNFAHPEWLWLLLLLPLVIQPVVFGGRRLKGGRRWGSLAVRLVLFLAAVGALSGTQIVRTTDRLAVVYLIDSSDSVGHDGRARATEFVRQSLATLGPNDQAGIIVFGQNAVVDRAVSADKEFGEILSQPVTTHTNIAGAIQLGMALFPTDYEKRIVLLSDGAENLGDLGHAARLAAGSGVRIDVVALNPPAGDEVLVESVVAPTSARENESIDVRVGVRSTIKGPAALRLYADGTLLSEDTVNLDVGLNQFVVPAKTTGRGFRVFQAQVVPTTDTLAQNNEQSAFTFVKGKPSVLVVEDDPGAAGNLQNALNAGGLDVTVVAPDSVPDSFAGLAPYDSVVLVNVPADALNQKMGVIQNYVRDQGRGLVVIGGDKSYGVGGYARTPLEETLPVNMDPRNRADRPNVAMVFAVDKSGSMGRCHCGGSSVASPRLAGGLEKIEIAKDAAHKAIALLGSHDEIGIVAFDSVARWVVNRQEVGTNPDPIYRALDSLKAEGNTNMFAGLDEAIKSLAKSPAKIKHAVLITDGWSRTGNYDALLQEVQKDGITLSTVGAGGGAADLLEGLATKGGGRFYAVADANDVPEILVKETKLVLRNLLQEQRFQPQLAANSSLLQGINATPALNGYVATSPKERAQVILTSDQDDPILSQWQYGLGRAVAWTSDVGTRWGSEWAAWDDYSRFWTQVVRSTITEQSGTLQAEVRVEGDKAVIVAESVGSGGEYRDLLDTHATIVTPDKKTQDVVLAQTAPGHYEASVPIDNIGVYVVQVLQQQGDELIAQRNLGFSISYSPEYAATGVNQRSLQEAMDLTGGKLLQKPDEAAVHDLKAVSQYTDIWPWLLGLALILLPVDVAVRRLVLTREEMARLSRRLLPAFRTGAGPPMATGPPTWIETLSQSRRTASPNDTAPATGPPPEAMAASVETVAAPAQAHSPPARGPTQAQGPPAQGSSAQGPPARAPAAPSASSGPTPAPAPPKAPPPAEPPKPAGGNEPEPSTVSRLLDAKRRARRPKGE